MPDKYSFAKCEQYGRRLAARLCQQHFAAEPEATLTGPVLLQLTPLRQVNLLVLQQLLDHWQRDASQLRSPYFDFEAEAVRTALTQFMNVLSRHIAVGRAALEPLLATAIAHTLLLATDPAAAFARLLLPPAATATDAEVPAAVLRERLRYFDGSKAFFTGFVESLPGGNAPLSREFLRQRFELYQASRYKELPILPPLVAELSALLPLTEADLREDGPSSATVRPSPAKPEPISVQPEPVSVEPQAASEKPEAVSAEPRAASVQLEAASVGQETVAAQLATQVPIVAETTAPVVRPVVPSFVAAAESEPTIAPLHEKLKASQPAGPQLAEALRGAAHTGTTLAERGAPRVGSLREAISINQRYGFINELFNGENGEYHAVIEHLDQLPTAAEALAYVQHELVSRHDWGRKEEHVGKLLKMIERKFNGA